MKQQETPISKEKFKIKPLPGNIKPVMGKSMIDKFEHAKSVLSSIKGFKK